MASKYLNWNKLGDARRIEIKAAKRQEKADRQLIKDFINMDKARYQSIQIW